jgi:hypothetical protein
MSEVTKTQPTLVPLADHTRLNLPFGPRTVDRRAAMDPDFPPVIRVGGRRFVEADKLDQYRDALIERGKATPPLQRNKAKGGD